MTSSGEYANIAQETYAATIIKTGNVCIARISLLLKAVTGENVWREIYTIPAGYEALNMSKNTPTRDGKSEQLRIDGNKIYINIPVSVDLGDVISDQIVYIKS